MYRLAALHEAHESVDHMNGIKLLVLCDRASSALRRSASPIVKTEGIFAVTSLVIANNVVEGSNMVAVMISHSSADTETARENWSFSSGRER